VIGKFIDGTFDSEKLAEEALGHALEVNPRLSVAHKFYAYLEAEMGQAARGLVRLLGEAGRHRNDPELYAGLVHACRYCGLYEESIAAHAEARRLDPNVPTSLVQTLLLTGDTERLLTADPFVAGEDDASRVVALGTAGRREEARQALVEMRERASIPLFQAYAERLMAWLDGRPDDMIAHLSPALRSLKVREDPEAIFREGWLLCDAGAHEAGLAHVRRAVAKGYFAAPALARNPQFDALRSAPAFQELLEEAEAGRQRALAAFREHGGERLLGRCCT
jgi:tetratricopeptide (TPR) repeat protein